MSEATKLGILNKPSDPPRLGEVSLSPFGKLRFKKYQIIEILEYSHFYNEAYNFLWMANRWTREFLIKQFLTI